MAALASQGVCRIRPLQASDEAAFVGLLRAVYGDTYSYRALYEPGGLAALLTSGKAWLWGDFAPDGHLIGHTGFFAKDARSDDLESGMSFRAPHAVPYTADPDTWTRLFGWLQGRCALVHQNTSTWHPLAQRYAIRHMRAQPTGFIVDYVQGERLRGTAHPETPMQALTMTTVIEPSRLEPSRVRVLPAGPWGAWAEPILRSFGAARFDVAAPYPDALGFQDLELNPSIGLRRRELVAGGARAVGAFRTELLHVAFDARMGALPRLLSEGWVPVGVRPQASRLDELVLQHLPGERLALARASLSTARLEPRGKALLEGWLRTCAEAS